MKHAVERRAEAGLLRAERLHARVRHPSIVPLREAVETADGRALVFDWVDGEVLYRRPAAAPLELDLAALDAAYDAHLAIAAAGFVAVDLYDGSVMVDAATGRTWLYDLDEYREGPFRLEAERLPGSTRFMAPEEWVRGARIDQITNVYTLGRLAVVLLSDGDAASAAWRGGPALRAVIERATQPERGARHADVAAFVRAWREARTEFGACGSRD